MRAFESYRLRFTRDSLKELYYTRVGVHPTVGIDKTTGKQFEEDLDSNIELILRKAANCSYRFTNYRQMLMLKGCDEAPRELCVPTIRDKLTLAALGLVLDDVYGLAVAQPMPQALVDEIVLAIRSGRYDTFAKYDIRRFYSSIDHVNMISALRRKVRKHEVCHLVKEAISTPSAPHGVKVRKARSKGVPEGLSISGKLANLYVQDIDLALQSVGGIASWRYVDDILVLCNQANIPDVEKTIEQSMKTLGLAVHSDKCLTGLISKTDFTYLGYRFLPDGTISVRTKSTRNVERALASLIGGRNAYKNYDQWLWRLNARITGCRITNDGVSFERYGWIHFFSRINDIGLLYHLDWLVGKLLSQNGIARPQGLKSFRKAYYEIRYRADATAYIPTYGANMTVVEKRKMLSRVFNEYDVEDMSDETVNRVFNDRIRREARRLERDVGLVS